MEKVRSPAKLCSVCWVFISNVLDSHTKVKETKKKYKKTKTNLSTYTKAATTEERCARQGVSFSIVCQRKRLPPPLVISPPLISWAARRK